MTNKKNIEIDDFIVEELIEKPIKKVDPKARLIDFANIKVAAIDPRVKKEINDLIDSAKSKISRIKSLLK